MRFDEIPHSIIDQARAGNHQAMEQLCEMIQPGAYAVLLSVLRDADEAADALQEALIRVVRFLPTLRDTAQLPAWLMRMLTNQAHTSRRKIPAAVIDVSSLEDGGAEGRIASSSAAPLSPRTAAAALEISEIINRAVTELPARQRMALVLYEMEQLSVKQVAAVMELSDGAVKFHLYEARKNLREYLAEMGITSAELCQEDNG